MTDLHNCSKLGSYNSISLTIRQRFFSFQKPSQKSRSILLDGSRSLGLFRKGKSHITAKNFGTDLVICCHFRDGQTPSYSRISMVNVHVVSFVFALFSGD